MEKIRIGILTGSLRRESYSKKIGLYVADLLPEDFTAQWIDLGNLQLYNQDYDDDGNPPQEWQVFRQTIKDLDGFLFVTPEYNRSVTPALKNALDIASRPFGQNAWNGKPGAIISVTPGKLGAFGANHHLRQPMVFLNIPLLQQPEVYISNIANLFNDKGEIVDQHTKDFLQNFADSFANWIRTLTKNARK
ncbi:MAG: NAD(P)H-dependent oxidoreductase [Planctomycetaceae bacterium]|jgi:chromate reductase|nr:NAD(P)H-dependent oxidoreductase [Planctomycetaceae bacterium]